MYYIRINLLILRQGSCAEYDVIWFNIYTLQGEKQYGETSSCTNLAYLYEQSGTFHAEYVRLREVVESRVSPAAAEDVSTQILNKLAKAMVPAVQ